MNCQINRDIWRVLCIIQNIWITKIDLGKPTQLELHVILRKDVEFILRKEIRRIGVMDIFPPISLKRAFRVHDNQVVGHKIAAYIIDTNSVIAAWVLKKQKGST